MLYDKEKMMEIISEFEDHGKKIYTVAIQDGKCVDVCIVESVGLIYIMQNADGSLVHDAENPDNTYPDYYLIHRKSFHWYKNFGRKTMKRNKKYMFLTADGGNYIGENNLRR